VILIPSFLIASNWRPILSLDLASIIYYFVSQTFIVGQETYFYLFTKHGTLGLTLHPGTMPNLLYKLAPVPQAWTLALEFYFYLLAPLIVRRGPAFIGAIIAASVLLRMMLLFIFGLSGDPWSSRFFPSELALFLTGSLCYYAYAPRSDTQRRQVYVMLSTAAVLLPVCLAFSRWDGLSRLASLALLGAVIMCVPHLFELTRNLAWDRYLGELSYPLYICHFLIGWMVLPETVSGAYVSVLLSLALSTQLYRWVERPIDRWRQSRFENAPRSIEGGGLMPAISR
jgi:peptidoglycan/LPS O-acetylase OafA/YrhL